MLLTAISKRRVKLLGAVIFQEPPSPVPIPLQMLLPPATILQVPVPAQAPPQPQPQPQLLQPQHRRRRQLQALLRRCSVDWVPPEVGLESMIVAVWLSSKPRICFSPSCFHHA